MNFKLTEWASFSGGGASLSRDDAVTKVGEISIGKAFFKLDFPVDALCRLEFIFPSDMPLTDDFKNVTASGIIDKKVTEAVDFKDISSRTFRIDGCLEYRSKDVAQ